MLNKINYNHLTISLHSTILDALKKMDAVNHKLLILLDGEDFFSLLSIGDIQRAIIENIDLNMPISYIAESDKAVAKSGDSIVDIKQLMLKMRCEYMPIVNDCNKIESVVFWSELFEGKKGDSKLNLNMPVVIMAGGKGSRLKPITNVLPKPLIPIGDKTILEDIMDRFVDAGCSNFLISVNYKADMIKYYFSSIENSPYTIDYFQEDKPLGTAGSMFLIKDKIKSTFFVSNCDIIIDQDLSEIYKYHKDNKNVITVVSVLNHYKIPYGTIETGENGMLKELKEKPELLFQINSGMYILEPELLKEIPENEIFHITELIEKVKNSGRSVGVFPVSEGSWKDIGEWNEYLKLVK